MLYHFTYGPLDGDVRDIELTEMSAHAVQLGNVLHVYQRFWHESDRLYWVDAFPLTDVPPVNVRIVDGECEGK